MRRGIRALATWLPVLIAGSAFAQPTGVTFPQQPPDTSRIADEAGIIDDAAQQEINQIAVGLQSEERIPIYVVTIRSLAVHGAAGMTIEGYASTLFNTWGIGLEQHNYGMLLLVSVQDRQARIELGADWGHTKDAEVQQIMNTLIVPEFRRGNYGAGVLGGVRGLAALARGEAIPHPKPPWWALPVLIAVLVGLIALIANLFRTGRRGWAWALIAALAVMLFFIMRSAASNRGGGFSGGSGFGGGFSGGGGATGSW